MAGVRSRSLFDIPARIPILERGHASHSDVSLASSRRDWLRRERRAGRGRGMRGHMFTVLNNAPLYASAPRIFRLSPWVVAAQHPRRSRRSAPVFQRPSSRAWNDLAFMGNFSYEKQRILSQINTIREQRLFYPANHGTTSANRLLDPLLTGRRCLCDAARRAGRERRMRGTCSRQIDQSRFPLYENQG